MKKRIFMLGVLSDKGIIKQTNQDSILVQIGEGQRGEFGLFAIADGMGGHAAGDVASSMAINSLKKWWNSVLPYMISYYDPGSFEGLICDSIEEAIYAANTSIWEYSSKLGLKVGTTLSVLFIFEDMYLIKHIGDSRIYKVNKRISQLTEDHSWVSKLVQEGCITKEEASTHPKRNLLTRCLGIKKEPELFEARGRIHKNDVFVLCSDGFYVKLGEQEILNNIEGYRYGKYELQGLVDALFAVVKNRGEEDNVSAIFIAEAPDKDIGIFGTILCKLKGLNGK